MVYIGIPSYDHKLHWTTAKGLVNTALWCAKKNVGFAFDVIPGDAFVGKARNLIAHRFMKSGFRDLVYVDADVGFDVNGIGLLCKAAPPIVMGLYKQKSPPPARFPALLFDPIIRHSSDRNLVKLQYGPAGFMRVRREVFQAMQARWPEEYYENAGEERLFDYFPAGREVNHFYGEDLQFCRRAQACGFDIWAMQNIELKHSGENCWESNWAIDVLQIDDDRHGNIKKAAA